MALAAAAAASPSMKEEEERRLGSERFELGERTWGGRSIYRGPAPVHGIYFGARVMKFSRAPGSSVHSMHRFLLRFSFPFFIQ